MAEVKHITMDCPYKRCDGAAFVQVLVVEDVETQKKIDAKANIKLTKALKQQHKDGLHD